MKMEQETDADRSEHVAGEQEVVAASSDPESGMKSEKARQKFAVSYDHQERRKKKRLYKAIREQMEFYFSDSNLPKDKFLSNLIANDEEGYVDAEIFLRFNKIKALTSEVTDIIKALHTSEILNVSDDKKRIKRVTPVIEKDNVDDCTIYVENIPPHAEHDWLKSVFSVYGPVTYVSLPRFKHTGKPKGFAFVEFDTPEAAQKACEHFGSSGIIKEPGHFELKEYPPVFQDDDNEERKSGKRKHDEEDAADDEGASKRAKLDDEKEEAHADEAKITEEQESAESEGNKKKKRRRKKKKKQFEMEQEIETINLRVMHKTEWRRWRNKYLSLQKSMMSRIKQSLSLCKEYNQPQEYNEEDADSKKQVAKDPEPTKKPGLEFTPNVIIRITTEQPITELSGFKQSVRNLGTVAYVDAMEGETVAHARCPDEDNAQKVLKAAKDAKIGKVELLKGNEEKAYWDKLLRDREAKFSNKTRIKKRGVDKVLARAQKMIEAQNKHIHF